MKRWRINLTIKSKCDCAKKNIFNFFDRKSINLFKNSITFRKHIHEYINRHDSLVRNQTSEKYILVYANNPISKLHILERKQNKYTTNVKEVPFRMKMIHTSQIGMLTFMNAHTTTRNWHAWIVKWI